MWPVVPNFHDSIPCLDSNSSQASTLTSSYYKVTSSVDHMDSLSWTKDLTASMPPLSNCVAPQIYVPPYYCRSNSRDLVLSTQSGPVGDPSSRDYNTSEDCVDRSGLLVSVNVVPKTSGAGYDVHRSSHYTFDTQAGGIVERPGNVNFRSTTTARHPRPKSESYSAAHFSKNIGNPVFRKHMQEKLMDATNKANQFRSPNLDKTVSSQSTSDIMTSYPESPKANLNGIPVRATSPLRLETENTLSELYLSSNGLDEVDGLFAHARNTATRGLRPTDNASDSVFNFHESLFSNTPQKGSSVGVDTHSNTLYRPGTPKLEQSRLLKKETPRKKSDHSKVANSKTKGNNSNGLECNCHVYHSHKFTGNICNHDVEARKERRRKIILESLASSEEHRKDGVDDPRNVFWLPTLAFHPYRHGDAPLSFSSLWPKYKELRALLQNSGIQLTVLNADTRLDLCTLACTCGPVHLLQCLIDLELIRVDQILESGSGLLHLSVLAHNLDVIQYLVIARVRPDIQDRQGLTADQVCHNPLVRKHLPPRYLLNKDMSRDKILLKPSLQDKDTIFKLAYNPKLFVDIQKKIQCLDLNVNTECDNNGDFLLHLVVKQGLNQLPLLMALVKIQGADIELCNGEGMTALMLAASVGNFILCDVLMCLFGADPNKPNPNSGRSALHYAAEGNHRKSVECLIKRGADVNMEDHEGLRADDVPQCVVVNDDCKEVICFHRTNRIQTLNQLVKADEVIASQLVHSDLCVVDSEGYTLIMTAAMNNRYVTLHCLLEFSKVTINAQHHKTGMTALAMAACYGHVEAVSVLLRHKATPAIADMSGYLPLHHAVLNDQEHTVDIILDHFPSTYIGLYKALRICKKTSIHSKLKRAWDKRQDEIVTPKLLSCALSGDAEELYKMLEEGDNINPKSATGNWPLYLAVENGHFEVVKLLFEKGGDIRKRHLTTGATALHVAAKMGHQAIVSYLIQYCKQYHRKKTTSQPGSGLKPSSGQASRKRYLDINAMDRENKTALQVAAERGYSKIVELLLSYGATTAMLDHNGNLVTCPQYEGVRIIIEGHREQHIKQIVSCIEDKSKKALTSLQQIWLPKFDHHLRDKGGNTPLMIAAKRGKIAILEFLLESAVYPEISQYESESDTDSDTDSGMLDQTKEISKDDDLHGGSLEAAPSSFSRSLNIARDIKEDFTDSGQLVPNDALTNSLEVFFQKRLSRIVNDANKPKGLSIYHDGLVSHVCAVNLLDGTTALHQALKASDNLNITALLVNSDPAVLTIQDDKGETVLHAACRWNRKKCVEFILSQSDLDLNLRARDGCLPEELTSSRAIRKLLQKARASVVKMNTEVADTTFRRQSSVAESEHSSSVRSSMVNFDKIHTHYEALKHGGVKTSA